MENQDKFSENDNLEITYDAASKRNFVQKL